jgi:hypothetical protein
VVLVLVVVVTDRGVVVVAGLVLVAALVVVARLVVGAARVVVARLVVVASALEFVTVDGTLSVWVFERVGEPPPHAASATPAMTMAAGTRNRIRFTPPACHSARAGGPAARRAPFKRLRRKPDSPLVTSPSEGSRRSGGGAATLTTDTAPATKERDVR